MPSRSLELVDKAFQLSKSGVSLDEIAKVVGRSRTEARHYIMEGALRFERMQDPRSILHLGLDMRTVRPLWREGIETIDCLIDVLNSNPLKIMTLNGFGEKSYSQVINGLKDGGYLPPEKE